MRKQTALIVDNNMLQQLWQAARGPDAWDSLFRGNRQVVLLSHVKNEALEVEGRHGPAFEKWTDLT